MRAVALALSLGHNFLLFIGTLRRVDSLEKTLMLGGIGGRRMMYSAYRLNKQGDNIQP